MIPNTDGTVSAVWHSRWLEYLPHQVTLYIMSLKSAAYDSLIAYVYYTIVLLLYFCELVFYAFGTQVLIVYYD